MIFLVVKNEGSNFGKPVNIKDIVACRRTLTEAQEEHKILCIASGDLKGFAIRGPYHDDTELEAFTMLHNGMQLIDKSEFLNTLDHLGYTISKDMTFNYFNTGNELHYKAKSVSIIEKDTLLSFANVDARRDENFKNLQRIRLHSFVFDGERIWEL